MSRISLRSRTSRLAALAVTGAMVFGGTTMTAPAAQAVNYQTCVRPPGSAPLLQLGSQSPWVAYAQCLINNSVLDADPLTAAADLVRDGKFGRFIDGGVRKFQGCAHITVDGKVGSNTWTALTYWAAQPNWLCR